VARDHGDAGRGVICGERACNDGQIMRLRASDRGTASTRHWVCQKSLPVNEEVRDGHGRCVGPASRPDHLRRRGRRQRGGVAGDGSGNRTGPDSGGGCPTRRGTRIASAATKPPLTGYASSIRGRWFGVGVSERDLAKMSLTLATSHRASAWASPQRASPGDCNRTMAGGPGFHRRP
jgi:hypothetical protein